MRKTGFVILAVLAGLSATASAVSFTGNAIGSWNDPVLESRYAEWSITSGNADIGGVARVKWGDPAYCDDRQSFLEFDGAGSDYLGQPPQWSSENGTFLLGTLNYFNGTQWADSGLEGVDLSVLVSILSPDIGQLSAFEIDMHINNRLNPAGDTVTVFDVPDPLGFTYGGHLYAFEVLGFSMDSGRTMTTSIFACEDRSQFGGFYARIYERTLGTTSVPDYGSTIALLGIATLGLGILKARRFA